MIRLAGPLLADALALLNAHANAQAGATPPAAAHQATMNFHWPTKPNGGLTSILLFTSSGAGE